MVCQILQSSTSPLKLEGYSSLGDLEYVLKRAKQELAHEQDEKDRRSTAGSSFVRFGRSRKSLFSEIEQARDYPMNHPQTRSDVVIRYGRSDKKNSHKLRRSDSGFIRYGRSSMEKDLRLLCSDFEETSLDQILHFYPAELVRLCESLGEDRAKE